MYPRTTDIAEILRRCTPSLRGFFGYWDDKRGVRRMPARGDIDPVEMKPWLAHMQLIDVFHNPRRLIYRLVGETDVAFRGYNPTGKSVDEFCVGVSTEETLRNYDICITQREPVFDWAAYVSNSGFLRNQSCILLPLSNDDDIVNMVMTFAEVDVEP